MKVEEREREREKEEGPIVSDYCRYCEVETRRGGGKVDREERRKRLRRRCGSPGWERLEDFSEVARGGKDEGAAGKEEEGEKEGGGREEVIRNTKREYNTS